jgi:hypothetical protein
MGMFILTRDQGLEWHVYLLAIQFDYNDLFDYSQMRHLVNLNKQKIILINVDTDSIKRDSYYKN